jgi:hypothetical protein
LVFLGDGATSGRSGGKFPATVNGRWDVAEVLRALLVLRGRVKTSATGWGWIDRLSHQSFIRLVDAIILDERILKSTSHLSAAGDHHVLRVVDILLSVIVVVLLLLTVDLINIGAEVALWLLMRPSSYTINITVQ